MCLQPAGGYVLRRAFCLMALEVCGSITSGAVGYKGCFDTAIIFNGRKNMRRFAKRLLTGLVSGVMALSLFSVVDFGSCSAKTEEVAEEQQGEEQSDIAAVEYRGNEMNAFPGDNSAINAFEVVYIHEKDGNRWEEVKTAHVIDASVADEYKDYITLIQSEDYSGDGYPDFVDVLSQSEWVDETEIIRADKRRDSVGKAIPLTVSYVDGDDVVKTAPFTYNIVDSKYSFEYYFENATNNLVPGQSQGISVNATHMIAEWNDNADVFVRREAELENPSYSWTTDVDFVSVEGNGSKAVLTASKLKEGAQEEDFPMWYNVRVELFENNKAVDEYVDGGFYTDVSYGITLIDRESFAGLKIGESINYKPVISMYNADNLPSGTPVEDADIELRHDDEMFEVKENTDGSYTITRLSGNAAEIYVRCSFKDVNGDTDYIDADYFTDGLDLDYIGLIPSNGTYLIFDDSKAVSYTLDTSKLEAMYENPEYTVKWKVIRREGESEEIFGADSEGWSSTSARDGIKIEGDKVTLDGTVIVPKYTVTEENGEKRIDNSVIWIELALFDKEGEKFFENEWAVYMRNAFVEYSKLEDEDFEEYITLLPGETAYLDRYRGFVQNGAYPAGRYFPLDINVTSIKSYGFDGESDGVPPEKFNLLTFDEADGRKALTAVSVIPSGAKEDTDLYGQSVVNITYKDIDGNEKSAVLHVENIECTEDVRFTSITSTGGMAIRIDKVEGDDCTCVDTHIGDAVAFEYEYIRRKYNEETGRVEEGIITPSRTELETIWDYDGIEAVENDGVITVISSSSKAGSLKFRFKFFRKPDETSVAGEYEEWQASSIDALVKFEYDILNELPHEDIAKNGIGEWTPKMTRRLKEYSEPHDITNEFKFGFSYNEDELSITTKDGKEVGDSFADGPFVIAKKTAADVSFRILIADAIDGHAVYNDDYYDVTVSGPAADLTTDISTLKISSIAAQAWTGNTIKPTITIKDGAKTLKSGTDYTVLFKNNKNVGKAKVIITGKGDYSGTVIKTFLIKKPELKYRAYVQKKNWMTFQTAAVSATADTKTMAGTTDNLRMETIQMQLSGVGGEIRYRAYCQKKGWVGVGTATGGWATTANKNTNAGTKGESRRVEMIQLQTKGEVSTLYDIYYQAYSEKFGWLAWAGNNEKAGSAGYAYKLEAFRVQLVPKGAKFDKTKGASKKKSFYDKTKDGTNPK